MMDAHKMLGISARCQLRAGSVPYNNVLVLGAYSKSIKSSEESHSTKIKTR